MTPICTDIKKETRRNQNKLCASQRVVRGQTFNGSGSFAHFRLLGMCTAGCDEGNKQFEIDSLLEHIHYYIRLLKQASQLGIHTEHLRLVLFDLNSPAFNHISEAIYTTISEQHPNIHIKTEDIESGHSYYYDLRFHSYASNRQGDEFLLVDGGFTNWTQQLLSSPKERLLTSGIGTERLVVCF